MARKEFSRKVKAAIIKRAAGRCEACKAALKPGEGDVDHILPDALGGKPEELGTRSSQEVSRSCSTGWLLRLSQGSTREYAS